MTLNEALSILTKHNYTIKKMTLNESNMMHFSTADQFISYKNNLKNKGYLQDEVKLGCINTALTEKELKNTGNDIGEVIIKRYCKDYETSKKDLQEAWNLGWQAEDPEGYHEDDFKNVKDKKGKKCDYLECVEIFKKAAIMHAFLNNF